MPAHTPGPWEMAEAGSWKDGKRTSTEYFVRRPGDDVAIASEIIDPANDDAPSEANARLIAAAPDLLEALESFIALNLRNDGATCDWHDLIAAVANAEKAVKKAKGETP